MPKLAELLPTSADEIFTATHQSRPVPTSAEVKQRADELSPLRDALARCIRDCGQLLPKLSPEEELDIVMATALLIDDLIQYRNSSQKAAAN